MHASLLYNYADYELYNLLKIVCISNDTKLRKASCHMLRKNIHTKIIYVSGVTIFSQNNGFHFTV